MKFLKLKRTIFLRCTAPKADFCATASIFNNYFASTCTPIKNASVLPLFSYKTSSRINSFKVSESDILSIIKSLDSTKTHGYDSLSTRMIKMCIESITLPLKIIFQESLKKVKFPEIWKKANVVPEHKKENKTFIVNYCPVSLLPTFGKIYERLVYNYLFNNFLRNKLFTSSQSGFLPGDSCITQLLSILHEIETAWRLSWKNLLENCL